MPSMHGQRGEATDNKLSFKAKSYCMMNLMLKSLNSKNFKHIFKYTLKK